jgi:glutaconyl-CoA/methylmalonyl-CoA decarboxylase subunit delta
MTASACTLLAAGLPENPTTLELLVFSATGMFVVLLSLSLLAVSCVVVGYVLRAFAPRPLLSRNSAGGEGELTDEMVAVVAAAVAEVISSPHRIVHIRGLTSEDLGWSLEGRLQHHASHKNPHPHR